MTALARLQTAGCALPLLDLYTTVNGMLADVYAVSFQIYDKTTGTPVQMFPATLGDRMVLDVVDDCPAGARMSVGRYVATWTVPGNANIGTFYVKWYFKLTINTPEQTFIEEFEVLPEITGAASSPAAAYVLVSEMREEGVPSTYTDDWLAKRIQLASRFVDASTRRFFYPKALTLRFDGRGAAKLLLSDPIIALDYVKFETSPLYPDDFSSVETNIIRVYNRHLSEGLLEPDDRNNPKIELFNPGFVRERQHALLTRLSFPLGQQNIEVKGVFGYTDPDGPNTQGKTPDLIKHVTKLIVIKELAKMSRTAARFDARARMRLTSERTRDQAYTLEPLGALRGALFTGDPEIDNILAYFSRPPALGAA